MLKMQKQKFHIGVKVTRVVQGFTSTLKLLSLMAMTCMGMCVSNGVILYFMGTPKGIEDTLSKFLHTITLTGFSLSGLSTIIYIIFMFLNVYMHKKHQRLTAEV